MWVFSHSYRRVRKYYMRKVHSGAFFCHTVSPHRRISYQIYSSSPSCGLQIKHASQKNFCSQLFFFFCSKAEGFINVHFYFQILLTSIISFQSNFRVTSVSSFQVTLCLWVILKSHLCRPCTDWWTFFRLIQLFFYPSHILN